MERVLGVLQDEGMKFPVIALAREQKAPAHGRTPNPKPNPARTLSLSLPET